MTKYWRRWVQLIQSEFEIIVRPAAKWNITANYAYVDGSIQTKTSGPIVKDTSYYNLYRRPKNTLSATIDFQASKQFFTSIGFRAVGKRDDLFFNSNTFATEPKELKAYYNLDFYASYQPIASIKIFADLRNITDQEYFDQYGYNNRRFNFMAGAIFNF